MTIFFTVCFSIILFLGVISPVRFLKLTEFWRVGVTREPSALMLKLTRYMSVIAIVLIWLRYFNVF